MQLGLAGPNRLAVEAEDILWETMLHKSRSETRLYRSLS
jgi:hypothetical protein